MAGAESFTLLAILEARDRASEIFAHADESLDKFSETARSAAETAREAGLSIDESLFKTASGADALDVADARVSAARERATRTADELAHAERNLLSAHHAAADAADDDTAAQYRLMEADERVTALSKQNAAAQKELTSAQKLQADTASAAAAKNDAAAASQVKVRDSSKASAISLATVGKVAGVTALGLGIAAGVMVHAAGNFQDSTVHLMTDAGVTQKNLGLVQAGILQVSTATGQSASSITNAMYHIASSGFTSANGINVLKVAAQGARVGGADLDTTTKTLVGTLTAYYGASLNAGQATRDSTSLMSQMITTVSRGDMRMQDLASSLSAVTPIAAAAHLSFSQVGGAVATMTAQGMSAQQATQDLANMIRNVIHPSHVASTEMRALGLNANQVSASFGKQGITGTLQEYTNAIVANSKGGNVLLGYMKEMDPTAQGLARSILAGTISTKQLRTAVYGLNPEQAKLISLFENASTSATGLKQTYAGAMSTLTGGATGLNVALMLSGKHSKDFENNVKAIGSAGRQTSGDLAGWTAIQSTFNFKMSQAKTGLENTGIAIGTALLPAATSLMHTITQIVVPIAVWTSQHAHLTAILFGTVIAITAVIAVVAVAGKAYRAVTKTIDDVGKAVHGASTLLQKLGVISKDTADTQAKSAADAATAQETAATDAATVQEGAAAEAAAATETSAEEAAAAQETAAAESSAGWVAASLRTVLAWAKSGVQMVAQAAVWVAGNTAKVAIVVAENVAGAVATGAAWVAANAMMLLGIGLVVAAVAAAVILIVTHWHDIVHGVEVAWGAVYRFISRILSDVVSFVRSHWPLIVGLVAGPLALAVAEVVKHWRQIEAWFTTGVRAVDRAVSWFNRLPGMFGHWIAATASAVWSAGVRFLDWYMTLPDKIYHWLSGLHGRMLSVGENIVKGIWNGISDSVGWLESKIGGFASSVLGDIASGFGLGSPSKYTHVHGLMLGAGLGNGLLASLPRIMSAVRRVSSAVLGGTAALSSSSSHTIGSSLAASAVNAAGSGSGGLTVIVDVHDNQVIGNSGINELANKIGNELTAKLPSGGRKFNLGG